MVTVNHREINNLDWEAQAKVGITKMRRTRRYENEIMDDFVLDADYAHRRRSPSMNHLHDQQRESAERSARQPVQMHQQNSQLSILPLDAS